MPFRLPYRHELKLTDDDIRAAVGEIETELPDYLRHIVQHCYPLRDIDREKIRGQLEKLPAIIEREIASAQTDIVAMAGVRPKITALCEGLTEKE